MRHCFRLPALLLTLLSLLTLAASSAQAASLRSDVLYLLPREVGQLVFIDLREVQRSPHYANLKTQLLPQHFEHFVNFLHSIGMDLDKDITWLAWVFVPPDEHAGERLIGIVEGNFAPERVERFFLQQKLPMEAYRGQTLFPFGSGVGAQDLFFSFLDSSTALFGTQPSLALLLETRYGAHENLLQNQAMLAYIDEVNGRAPVWAVFDAQYTQYTLAQLVPEAARFEEFGQIAGRFQRALLQVRLSRDLEVDFQTWCREPLDAQAFSLLLQTGLFVQRWRWRETNPELSQALEKTELRTLGERLQIRLTIPEEHLKNLLARGAFLFRY